MLKIVDVPKPVHLVGCGFGALLASMLTVLHSELVASATLSTRSNVNDLQAIISLPGSATRDERLQALHQCLTSDKPTNSLSDENIEEYAETYFDHSVLVATQLLSRASPRSDITATSTTSVQPWSLELRLDVSPEEAPEHFALSVLSHANSTAKHKSPDVRAHSPSERITCKM